MTPQTDLLRQVHPSWIQAGRVTSQAFRPTPKDQGRLSVYDGDRITPVDAWTHFTKSLGHRSAGVLAVTVMECKAERLDVRPDPAPFPEHVVIDFAGLSNADIVRASKRLSRLAGKRGWHFQSDA